MGPYAWWHPDWPSYLLHFLCAVYVTCATVRLAKFNVLKDHAVDVTGTSVFYGIPTTMAGGLIAATCLVGLEHDFFGLIVLLPGVLFVLGLCMVLNFPFPQLSKRPSKLVNAFVGINVVLSYTAGLFRIWPEYLLGLITFFFIWGLFWSLRYHKTLTAENLDPYAQ
jgi:phosphatidylserine synthase